VLGEESLLNIDPNQVTEVGKGGRSVASYSY